MQRPFVYMVLILLLFISCEEIYKPELKIVPGDLVVESNLSNDLNQNYVNLSVTNDFYNQNPQEKVAGARVDLVQYNMFGYFHGETVNHSTEISPGHYVFNETPVPGNNYRLRIAVDMDVYESNLEQMPALPTIDSLYTTFKITKSYQTGFYGSLIPVETPGQEICIDAPITPKLQYYRFNWRTILQWASISPPSIQGWISKYQDGAFNLAGIKEFSSSDRVTKHAILTLPYNLRDYLETDKQTGRGWIVILDQYGITKDSYNFHENLNKQLTAEGNLFDPLVGQVTGNLHCINDSSKNVLGYFNLNSYKQHRYFMYLGANEKSKVLLRQINQYPDIPARGSFVGIQPSFWETF